LQTCLLIREGAPLYNKDISSSKEQREESADEPQLHPVLLLDGGAPVQELEGFDYWKRLLDWITDYITD
jgi:hypothetical protein